MGDGDKEMILFNNRVPISELRADIGLHWDSTELFDEKFSHEGGMIRGAAGNQMDPSHLLQKLWVKVYVFENGIALLL